MLKLLIIKKENEKKMRNRKNVGVWLALPKYENGITLIALIITIIVMIILAGVTINLVIQEGGLFSQARDATEEMRAASADERAAIWRIEAEMGVTTRTAEEMIYHMYRNGLLRREEVNEIIDGEIEGVFTYNEDSVFLGSMNREIHFRVGGILGNNPPGGGNGNNGGSGPQPGESDGNVNIPVLGNLIPVRYDGTNWVDIPGTTNENNEWYDYGNQRWANARDENHNMFVWIPRYSYRVPTRSANQQPILIRFLEGTTNTPADGDSITLASPPILGPHPGTVNIQPGEGSFPVPGTWLVHPAFYFDGRELPRNMGRQIHNSN